MLIECVSHILSGKAVSRAVRGHLLVYSCLHTMLVANAHDLSIPSAENTEEDSPKEDVSEAKEGDLKTARDLLKDSLKGSEGTDDFREVLNRIQLKIEEENESLSSHSTNLVSVYGNGVDNLQVHKG